MTTDPATWPQLSGQHTIGLALASAAGVLVFLAVLQTFAARNRTGCRIAHWFHQATDDDLGRWGL